MVSVVDVVGRCYFLFPRRRERELEKGERLRKKERVSEVHMVSRMHVRFAADLFNLDRHGVSKKSTA